MNRIKQYGVLLGLLLSCGMAWADAPSQAEQLKAGDELRAGLPEIDMAFGKRLFFEIKTIEHQPTVGYSDTTMVAAEDESGTHYQFRREVVGKHPQTGKILKFITEAKLTRELVPTEMKVVQSVTNEDRTASVITRHSKVRGSEVAMTEEMIDKKRERTVALEDARIVIGVEPLMLLRSVKELDEKAFREFLPDRGETRIVNTEVLKADADAPAGVSYKLRRMIGDKEDRYYLLTEDGKVVAVESLGAGVRMVAADPSSVDELKNRIYPQD